MALERWIALVIGTVFLLYGYTAFIGMDELLPPILKRNPVWPSTFPKILSVLGLLAAVAVLVNIEGSPQKSIREDINTFRKYRVLDALALVGGMIVYALALHPLGCLPATFLFLALGSYLLGERRYVLIVAFPAIASVGVWYLINSVLGVHLPPLPAFLG